MKNLVSEEINNFEEISHISVRETRLLQSGRVPFSSFCPNLLWDKGKVKIWHWKRQSDLHHLEAGKLRPIREVVGQVVFADVPILPIRSTFESRTPRTHNSLSWVREVHSGRVPLSLLSSRLLFIGSGAVLWES